ATILELFTGHDAFGETEHRRAGVLTEPGFDCAAIQSVDGRSPIGAAADCDVALPLATFSATAEMAGISRVMGGYHIQADNVAGLKLGRKIADHDWVYLKALFDGTAQPRPK